MNPVGPFLAHFRAVWTGPIILMSSSWQIAMNACSGVIERAPYSWLFARSSTCLPRAASFTRSRNRLTTRNSTSPSSSDSRTSRSASSMTSSLSSATPVSRWRAARKPLARVSSTDGPYSMLGAGLVDDEIGVIRLKILGKHPGEAGPDLGRRRARIADRRRRAAVEVRGAVGKREVAGIADGEVRAELVLAGDRVRRLEVLELEVERVGCLRVVEQAAAIRADRAARAGLGDHLDRAIGVGRRGQRGDRVRGLDPALRRHQRRASRVERRDAHLDAGARDAGVDHPAGRRRVDD